MTQNAARTSAIFPRVRDAPLVRPSATDKSALTSELYIEFDGQQVLLRTTAPEIIDFASRTYQPMLVARLRNNIGSIEIRCVDGEYALDLADGSAFHGDLESACRYLKQQVQLRFIGARSDLIWLHAAAAEREGKCLLIAGPPACGKSSLMTLLCDRGWRMLSDDVGPLRIDPLEVLPYPELPVRRIYPGRDFSREQLGSLDRESVHLAAASICREASAIGGVLLPVYRDGEPAELLRLPSGELALELVRSCMNFVRHKATAVTIATRIASAVAGHRLSYRSTSEAAEFLDSLFWAS